MLNLYRKQANRYCQKFKTKIHRTSIAIRVRNKKLTGKYQDQTAKRN